MFGYLSILREIFYSIPENINERGACHIKKNRIEGWSFIKIIIKVVYIFHYNSKRGKSSKLRKTY